MRLRSLLYHDVQFQIRHGFYFAYLLISMLYIILLGYIPSQEMKELIAILIVFSDPSTLGFFFVGGIILLEKDQGIYDPLFITPIQVKQYIYSKLFSLALLSTLSSILIKTVAFGFTYNLLNLFLGVFLSSLLFTLLGIVIATKAKTLNHFFLLSAIYTPIFFLPALSNLQIWDHYFLYLIPGKASLLLIEGSFRSLALLEYVYSLAMLFLSIIIAYYWTKNELTKNIIYKIGG